jgi:hypothetical protein
MARRSSHQQTRAAKPRHHRAVRQIRVGRSWPGRRRFVRLGIVRGTEEPDDLRRAQERLAAKEAELDERERRLAAREAAADHRDERADERDRQAGRRDMAADLRDERASERERLLDEEARQQGSRVVDGMGRFHEAVERTAARTERSNDLLQRSRESVQRGVDRIERLQTQLNSPGRGDGDD